MDLENILDRVTSLPPLPGTSVRLMNVISDPNAAVDDIVDIIKYDHTLTAQLLRLCNSSYFGLSRRVTSINEAIICLGTLKILQMVMAVHTTSILSAEQTGYGLATGALWKHSVAVALASSQVAARIRLPNVNLAFTAGLLHDIGKVVLNQYVAAEYSEIIRRVSDEGLTFIEAERDILGHDHTQIGAMIGERWNLPEQLVECIRYHHEPGELHPPNSLVDTVYVANCICLLLGIGLGADGLSYRADEAVMQRHGLIEQDLEAMSVATLGELQNVLGMFGIEPANFEIRQTVGK